jgi:hypothetical protein
MRASFFDGTERFIAVASKARAVSFVFQNSSDQFANVGFVVDNENIGSHRNVSSRVVNSLQRAR